ncbi:PWWP domain [Dillenia turbinata]|uniref:PWWP domain n=1 Tax=Dillenia turbinata TaxID=194707 RepID=A0AAN8VAX5_9MAGN
MLCSLMETFVACTDIKGMEMDTKSSAKSKEFEKLVSPNRILNKFKSGRRMEIKHVKSFISNTLETPSGQRKVETLEEVFGASRIYGLNEKPENGGMVSIGCTNNEESNAVVTTQVTGSEYPAPTYTKRIGVGSFGVASEEGVFAMFGENAMEELREVGQSSSGCGINLFVDVSCPRDETTQDIGNVNCLEPILSSKKTAIAETSVPDANQFDSIVGEMESGNGDHERNEVANEEEEVLINQDHNFMIGDLVWIKMKNQSWWPGQIFDPSDGSKSTPKNTQRNDNFEQMSTHSNTINFLQAVGKAADETVKRIQLVMTCSRISRENLENFSTQVGGNAGNVEGVDKPKSRIG